MAPAIGAAALQRAVERASRSRGKPRPSYLGECCCGSRCAWGKVPVGTDPQTLLLELKICSYQGASFSLFVSPTGLFEGVVCFGNEEPWQPRNCGVWQLVGRLTAGNIHWASSSRSGDGSLVSFYVVESILWCKYLNRLQSSAFNCPCLPVPEICIISCVPAGG